MLFSRAGLHRLACARKVGFCQSAFSSGVILLRNSRATAIFCWLTF
jgi:hypothetical protein